MRGVYKGIGPPLCGQVVINAVVFGVYGNSLRRLPNQGIQGQFIAGGLAGAVQSIFCSPIELIKTRMQLQEKSIPFRVNQGTKNIETEHSKYRNSMDCLLKIFKNEGMRGCMRGFNCTLLREVPSFAIYFASYNHLCQQFGSDSGSRSIPISFISGGISGILSWIVSYPADVIKTRLQADGIGNNKYNGILDCCVKCYRNEGFQVFFKGLNVTLLRAFPTNAATLTAATIFLDAFS